MALECKKILQEMSEEQFLQVSWETGLDMMEYFDNYNPDNEDDETKLSHIISQCGTFLRATSDKKMHRLCKRLFLAMAEMGNPEDTLLCFTEEVEFAEEADIEEMIVLIECIQNCLKRLPLTDYHPITWCYGAIIYHINNKVELPDEHNLEGQEKLLLDSDQNVINIDTLYLKLIGLIELILNELAPKLQITPQAHTDFKDETLLFLVKLLGKPMAYMDLEIHGENENTKNSFRNHCENLVSFIYLLKPDLLKYLDAADGDIEIGQFITCEFTYLSLGVLYYLIFHEGICQGKYPQVYNPIYIFKCVLDQAIVMLGISSNLVQRKGLLLCLSCLNSISDYQLKIEFLSRHSISNFSEMLPAIMVFSESKENRQIAVKLFRKFIFCLNSNGRYIVLLNIPRFSKHSGFVGYLTTIVKDIVANYLSSENKTDRINFSRKRLTHILKILVKLPQKVETDIAENSDTIISVLNFLRYLTLCDKNNLSGIWDNIEWIKKDYLIPLKKAIDLSKAHYKLEMKNTDQKKPEAPVSLSVGGQTLPNLTAGEKQDILNYAMNTFDLIDSLHARVLECIEITENSTATGNIDSTN